jgi:hypothetical protein
VLILRAHHLKPNIGLDPRAWRSAKRREVNNTTTNYKENGSEKH